MSAAWIKLLLAGVFEIGWPIGLKNAGQGNPVLWGGFSLLCLAISGALLFQAQKTIPMGTAYAVWTGIGAAGTFVVGIIVYGDSAGLMRILSVILIVGGVAGLKLSH